MVAMQIDEERRARLRELWTEFWHAHYQFAYVNWLRDAGRELAGRMLASVSMDSSVPGLLAEFEVELAEDLAPTEAAIGPAVDRLAAAKAALAEGYDVLGTEGRRLMSDLVAAVGKCFEPGPNSFYEPIRGLVGDVRWDIVRVIQDGLNKLAGGDPIIITTPRPNVD